MLTLVSAGTAIPPENVIENFDTVRIVTALKAGEAKVTLTATGPDGEVHYEVISIYVTVTEPVSS